ncbi:SDR family NAD(P)-dependent oxidoreductase [Psychrobacter sanguinis]|uniref:SDR family NAD(P)-dependent oxidoreductase n=1 Tax=Psychrobacter sanguinis TaxID=861445 RepID=UPI00020C9844|nr:SDR family NAD(P)-dependent oxidoreductase [Psychrobacter sanguinis]EGK12197.1 3-oxoacyl-[acyl-carrier-protein] reductase [Psychrobacter sp. 1501(2011)]MCD9151648.1 SDR family oxidoreductase [Psychrobacter sanguinis]
MEFEPNKTVANVLNKRILITGSASGIGAASARLLTSRGAKVVIADLAEDLGQALAEQAQAAGQTISFMKVDVTQAAEVEALFAYAVKQLGGLDVVINNAGVDHPPAPLHQLTEDDFDRCMAVNVKGVWHCMRAAIACLSPNGGGQVINVASIAGLRSAPMLSAYSASKHAVIGLTKSAAIEYARANIRFNAVCPSFIDTPMVRNSMLNMSEKQQQALLKASPMRRLGKVEEIASAIAWLASDESTFMNGHSLTLDGGMLA